MISDAENPQGLMLAEIATLAAPLNGLLCARRGSV
jgi:hypothetical protein